MLTCVRGLVAFAVHEGSFEDSGVVNLGAQPVWDPDNEPTFDPHVTGPDGPSKGAGYTPLEKAQLLYNEGTGCCPSHHPCQRILC